MPITSQTRIIAHIGSGEHLLNVPFIYLCSYDSAAGTERSEAVGGGVDIAASSGDMGGGAGIAAISAVGAGGSGGITTTLAVSTDPTKSILFRFAAFGCCGEGSPEQRKVASWLKYLHQQEPTDLAIILGDAIYPDGLEPGDARRSLHTVERLITGMYGDAGKRSDIAELTTLTTGNHEAGFHGFSLLRKPTLERGRAKIRAFVDALQGSKTDELPDNRFFMPNSYYAQIIQKNGQPVAVILYIDSSLLPIDEPQQQWLEDFRIWLKASIYKDLPVFLMSHHSLDFTVGPRGLKSSEASKYAIPKARKKGNQHQQVARILRGKGYVFQSHDQDEPVSADYVVIVIEINCHEHFLAILVTLFRHKVVQRAPTWVIGTGGATSNKDDLSVLAPGLCRTSTQEEYGFGMFEILRDGSLIGKFYNCTSLAEPPADHSFEFKPTLEITYNSNYCPVAYRVDGILQSAVQFSVLHPKLIRKQQDWFELIFQALATGNLSLLKLVIAGFTNCLHDLRKGRLSEAYVAELLGGELANIDLIGPAKAEVLLEAGEEAMKEAGAVAAIASAAAGVGGAAVAAGAEGAAAEMLAVPQTDSTTKQAILQLVEELKVPSLDEVAAYLLALENIIDDYARSTYTPTFNQLSALHYILKSIYSLMKPTAAVTETKGGADEVSFQAAVTQLKQQIFLQGAKKKPAKKVSRRSRAHSEEDDSPDPVEPLLPVPPSAEGRVRLAIEPGRARQDRPITEEDSVFFKAKLRLCAKIAAIQFLKLLHPEDYARVLERPEAYPESASALLLGSLVYLVPDPKQVLHGVLISGPSGLQDTLLHVCRTYCPENFAGIDTPAQLRMSLGAHGNFLASFFLEENALKIVGHQSLIRALAKILGDDNELNISRLIGKLQRIKSLLDDRVGLRGSFSTFFARGIVRSGLTEVVTNFFAALQQVGNKAALLTMIDERYFNKTGALCPVAAYSQDLVIAELVEFYQLLPEEADDFIKVRSALVPHIDFYFSLAVARLPGGGSGEDEEGLLSAASRSAGAVT
ncbi:MAG: hypothetical protein A3E87_08775 [Gammaproteobacteria bacterium RIFCSPHIGHO2_12_FULL_35_23]|nr:MAG: hypothetical protein A3E87_08775 [Gammaproteobacteria bacterium RIFCSPHIGHO2_12_FULL_35_23]